MKPALHSTRLLVSLPPPAPAPIRDAARTGGGAVWAFGTASAHRLAAGLPWQLLGWLLVAGVLATPPTRAQIPVTYTDFSGTARSLYQWNGNKIAFLTASNALDVPAMRALTTTFDGVYAFYASCTGRTPTQYAPTYLNGRSTVAQVPRACGQLSLRVWDLMEMN